LQNSRYGYFKEGETYFVTALDTCSCGAKVLSIGKIASDRVVCGRCNIDRRCKGDLMFHGTHMFAPIQTDRIRYVAVAEEVKEMEVCHN